MRLRGLTPWLLVASVSLAGCSGGNDKGSSQEEDLSATHGTVVGFITDDEARPVDGAAVSLRTVKVSPIALKIFTNSEGRFRLERVPAGKQTVVVEKDGYLEGSTTITVVPGAETTLKVTLRPRPITEYKVVPLAPIEGQYTCAWEIFVRSGPCDYEVGNNTGGTDPLPDENNETFEVPPNWGGLLFEIAWTIGGPPGGIEGIRFQLESEEDPGGMFVKADSTDSPMRIAIDAGRVAPDATLGYPIPQRGVKTFIHVLPLGHFDGSTCTVQCGYGAGAAVQIDYTVYVTIFYGGGVNPDYGSFD